MVLPARPNEKFIVAYLSSNDLYVSDVFDTYEEALKFATDSAEDGGVGDEKAIIIRAGSDCRGEPLSIDTEDHT